MTAQPLVDLPTSPVASVQGSLALEVRPRLDPPKASARTALSGADVVPVPLPLRRDLARWSHRFAQAAVEIAGGDRPVTQLLRWTTARVYADLERRAQLVMRAAGQGPGPARRRSASARPQVVSLHTSFIALDAAEVSVCVRTGARFRAVAARFEVIGGRWQCSALEFA